MALKPPLQFYHWLKGFSEVARMIFKAISGLAFFRSLQGSWRGECCPGEKFSQPRCCSALWFWPWVRGHLQGVWGQKSNRRKRNSPVPPLLHCIHQHGLVQQLILPWVNFFLPFFPPFLGSKMIHGALWFLFNCHAPLSLPFFTCYVFLPLSVISFFYYLLERREIAKIPFQELQ